ncbi:uncharacterized protein LOC129058268 [Pongo abelii]|uniref:uncharacterized protein LOC129058268 n=1 Tax=Pongo abelii TaxID=9601 RepID=UPI0023E83526|nr:uncharacterized protein LOC129058268 [Pongo abelii]
MRRRASPPVTPEARGDLVGTRSSRGRPVQGRGRVGGGDAAALPPYRPAVSRAGPHGCWTAPCPRTPAPSGPHSGTPSSARLGSSWGPRAGALGTRVTVPVVAAAPKLRRRRRRGRQGGGALRARSRPAVRCVAPALSLLAAGRPPLHLSPPTFTLPPRRPPHVLPAACACVVEPHSRLPFALWWTPEGSMDGRAGPGGA